MCYNNKQLFVRTIVRYHVHAHVLYPVQTPSGDIPLLLQQIFCQVFSHFICLTLINPAAVCAEKTFETFRTARGQITNLHSARSSTEIKHRHTQMIRFGPGYSVPMPGVCTSRSGGKPKPGQPEELSKAGAPITTMAFDPGRGAGCACSRSCAQPSSQ